MKNSKISIRPFQISDTLQVFQAIQESLAEVSPWLPDLNAELTLDEIREYIEAQPQLRSERKAYNFVITGPQEESILGSCGLTQINWQHRFANLYYWVRSSQTQRGVATDATQSLARFGFKQLGLERIEIVMAVSNSASIRVAEKAGASREGRLRHRISLYGKVHDAFMYSLIPSDLGFHQKENYEPRSDSAKDS